MSKRSDVQRTKNSAVKITLADGKERVLRYTLNAMVELEEAYGSVDEAFRVLEEEQSLKAMRKVIWAGLLHENDPLTEQEVGNLIDIDYMKELVASVGGALTADLPSEGQVKENGDSNLPNE